VTHTWLTVKNVWDSFYETQLWCRLVHIGGVHWMVELCIRVINKLLSLDSFELQTNTENKHTKRTQVNLFCHRDAQRARSFAFSRPVLCDIYSLLCGNVISTTIVAVLWDATVAPCRGRRRRRCTDRRQTSSRRYATPRMTFSPARYDTIRYDTRCYFNVRSKADISQLNLPHGTDN